MDLNKPETAIFENVFRWRLKKTLPWQILQNIFISPAKPPSRALRAPLKHCNYLCQMLSYLTCVHKEIWQCVHSLFTYIRISTTAIKHPKIHLNKKKTDHIEASDAKLLNITIYKTIITIRVYVYILHSTPNIYSNLSFNSEVIESYYACCVLRTINVLYETAWEREGGRESVCENYFICLFVCLLQTIDQFQKSL